MKKMSLLTIPAIVIMAVFWLLLEPEEEKRETKGKQPADQIQIENMGNTLTIDKPPKRAVALNQHAAEIMLALGLEEAMVGTAYLDDHILPEFKQAYDQIPVLSKQYPSKEIFFAAEPDFAYAGWKTAFTEKSLGTVGELKEAGIPAYIQESSNKPAPVLEDVYRDIRNIGRIFAVEKRAEKVIAQMKREIGEIRKKIGEADEPQSVFVYDSGQAQPTTAANNYLTHLIDIAGGQNIFSDINKGWATVNWESVIDRKPDVIIIMDYGDQTVAEKKKYLLSKKELADVPAVKNKRWMVLPLSAGAEGIRAPLALRAIAEGLHPDKF
ncbi:ABC transporter substrate-binding protein [Bacillus xiapuensis]|uniref:ABC transporter substrate-binding protein n=1 Tax=Bacillus xiapuensis TaxID=2014075 RepID=UPI000C240EE4|nr:ABC transporter substrate-binding protein [Bacillus xiapuensis]